MKKKITLLFLTSALFFTCTTTQQLASISPEKTNRTYQDKENHPQLVGYCTQESLKQPPFGDWFKPNYEQYEVDKTTLDLVKSAIKGIEIQVFMATWCRDSRLEVPRFFKIIDYLKIPASRITIINLYLDAPNYKQSPDHEEVGLNIHRVPTFLFYKKGQEIGRIVESPVNSLETDLAQILLGVPSKTNFQVVAAMQQLIDENGVEYVIANKEILARRTRYTAKNSSELNNYGYFLLGKNKKDEAVALFEINALAFPMDANVFDSLAEGFIAIGNTALAIENYEQVLKLDKENKQAIKMLRELKGEK